MNLEEIKTKQIVYNEFPWTDIDHETLDHMIKSGDMMRQDGHCPPDMRMHINMTMDELIKEHARRN